MIFNTGRNIELVRPLLDDAAIPNPHFIIGDVGASVLHGRQASEINTSFMPVEPVQNDISAKWDAALNSIEHLLEELDQRMERQEQPQERRMSYYVENEAALPMDLVERLRECECDVLHSNTIYFDILPQGVNKGSTLINLVEHLGIPTGRVMVAGDTMNDFSMYQHGFNGVVLENAEEPVKEAAKALDNVYYSSQPGTHGILEALRYFDLVK